MLIKDIKFRRIRKLARKNVDVSYFWYKNGDNIALLENAFDWRKSPEKHDFWKFINDGNYEEAFKLRPDLFRATKKEIKEAYKMHVTQEQYRIMGSLAG